VTWGGGACSGVGQAGDRWVVQAWDQGGLCCVGLAAAVAAVVVAVAVGVVVVLAVAAVMEAAGVVAAVVVGVVAVVVPDHPSSHRPWTGVGLPYLTAKS